MPTNEGTTSFTVQVASGGGTDTQPLSIRIGPPVVAAALAADNHTMILKTDGTLWAKGYNDSGQLGDGMTTDRSSPVEVF